MSELVVREVYAAYDRVDVLCGVNIRARAGQITCVLGSNGAGKSTLIRSVLGLTPPRAGSIRFGDNELTGLPPHRVVARGIACIPEGRRVFPRLSVADNLRAGAYQTSSRDAIVRRMVSVFDIFPRLHERQSQLAGTMSGGEQAMLSIGRGLMSDPKLLIIDEPSLGLSPLFVKENFGVIKRVNESGVSVLLVEQNVRQTLAIAHYGYVLSQGRVVAEGSAETLRHDPELQRAYFG